jgi:signal transduction histidine kinase
MDLAWLASRLDGDRPELGERLRSVAELVDRTIGTVRRIATELRPGVLDELGLQAAIEWQAAEFTHRTGIATSLDLDLPEPPGGQTAVALFRILQEALTNVARHSRASRVTIELRREGDVLHLGVADDGRGAKRGALAAGRSLGILGMRERAAVLGGSAQVRSGPRGTTVVVRLPRSDHEDLAP